MAQYLKEDTKQLAYDFFNSVKNDFNLGNDLQEYKDTGTFSKNLNTKFDEFRKSRATTPTTPTVGSIPAPITVKPTGLTGMQTNQPTNTEYSATNTNTGVVTDETAKQDVINTQNGMNEYDRQKAEAEQIMKDQIIKEKENKKKQADELKKQYVLGKGNLEEKKTYYSNFDEVNNIFNAVTKDITAKIDANGNLKDEDYQEVANKYGLSLEDVKDPDNIFTTKGQLTEKGKEVFGVNKGQAGIDKMTTDKNRAITDINTNLEKSQQNYNWQIEDIERQIKETTAIMEQSNSMGGLRTQLYLGNSIQKIKDEGTRNISRLKTLASQMTEATAENIKRIQEDFDIAYNTATKDLKTALDTTKQSTMLALSEAQNTFGTGSTKLSELLDELDINFKNKTLDHIAKYQNIVSNINTQQANNIAVLEKIQNKYDLQYENNYKNIASNPGVLINTSYTDLAQKVGDGTLNMDKAMQLKQLVLASVQSTLGSIAPITTQDLASINSLLDKGYTPAEVIAEMQTLDKFKQKQETISPKDQFVNVGGELYDTVSKKWVNKPGKTSSTTNGTINGTISGDLSTTNLPEKYKNEASFKNNNPTGLTWGISDNLKQMFDNAGISYEKGTDRPKNEGGSYIKFATIEDGLKAYQIAFTKAGTDDIYSRLLQWKSGNPKATDNASVSYANSILEKSGLKKGDKFSQLNETQLNNLVGNHLQRESPALYKELTNGTTTQGISKTDEAMFKEWDTLTGNARQERFKETGKEQEYLDWKYGQKTENIKNFDNIDIDTFTIMEGAKTKKTTKEQEAYLSTAGFTPKDLQEYNKEIGRREEKYKDLLDVYRQNLSLGGTISDSDAERMMKTYYTGLKDNDKTAIEKLVADSVLNKDKVKEANADYKQFVGGLKLLNDGLVKYKQSGGDTGLLTGKLEDIANKLGTSTDTSIGGLAELNTGIKMLQTAYIKATSGVGVSDSERAFLSNILPGVSGELDLNQAKIRGLLDYANIGMESVLKSNFRGDTDMYNKLIKPRAIYTIGDEKNYKTKKTFGDFAYDSLPFVGDNKTYKEFKGFEIKEPVENKTITPKSSNEDIMNALNSIYNKK